MTQDYREKKGDLDISCENEPYYGDEPEVGSPEWMERARELDKKLKLMMEEINGGVK